MERNDAEVIRGLTKLAAGVSIALAGGATPDEITAAVEHAISDARSFADRLADANRLVEAAAEWKRRHAA